MGSYLFFLVFLIGAVALIPIFLLLQRDIKRRRQQETVVVDRAQAASQHYPPDYQSPSINTNTASQLSSAKVSFAGGLFLISAMLIGGVALGMLLYGVSLLVYMPIIFPIGVGVAVGIAFRVGVQLTKVRDPLLCTICGVVMGVVIYGTFQYMEYQDFRQKQVAQIKNEANNAGNPQLSDTVANVVIDDSLQEYTGASGFWGYERLMANSGIELSFLAINRGIPLKFSIPLSGLGVWLYWLVEMGLISFLIALIVYPQADHPFDEESDQWFGDVSECLGSIPYQQITNFTACINDHDYVEIGRMMIAEEESAPPDLDIYTMFTPTGDEGNCYLFARQTRRFPDGKSKRSKVFNRIITSRDYHDLVSTFVDD